MHYIVDGYNLLFRVLTSSVDLATRRQTIIENLNKKIQLTEIDVTIVFDSQYRTEETTKSHYNHLEIQFTSWGITADEWIINKVAELSNPKHVTVVTSDKKLALTVRQSLVKTESVEEFVKTLNKRYKNKLDIQKNDPKSTKSMVAKQAILLHQGAACPSVGSSIDECFEFYLKEFEDHFSKIVKPEKPIKLSKQKLHEFPKEKKKEQSFKSEMERWQKLFEEIES